ncbi:MAG: NAD(P)-dependent oxidoreductase [Gemmatimonadales bacterium]|nr:NAD(P)-dependent oxidoreductase [Gemmatimonadales bacterium]
MRIAVTGSAGLIGRHLVPLLRSAGTDIVEIDLQSPNAPDRVDIRHAGRLHRAMQRCDGVIHLAAVSRVVWAEADPLRCWYVNVDGTRNIAKSCLARRDRPWLLFASSREVYGNQPQEPIAESAPWNPVNVYGRSKAAAEGLVNSAADAGLRTLILRFANVYGDTRDHPDRVVPAFARAAAQGSPIRVNGSQRAFDFTHVTEVAKAISTAVDLLCDGQRLPTIHLASGQATTLGDLARMTQAFSGGRTRIEEREAPGFDVSRFVGDTRLARETLGWQHRTSVETGFTGLAREFARELATVR